MGPGRGPPVRTGRRHDNDHIDRSTAVAQSAVDGGRVDRHHRNTYELIPSPEIDSSMLAMDGGLIKIAVVGRRARFGKLEDARDV